MEYGRAQGCTAVNAEGVEQHSMLSQVPKTCCVDCLRFALKPLRRPVSRCSTRAPGLCTPCIIVLQQIPFYSPRGYGIVTLRGNASGIIEPSPNMRTPRSTCRMCMTLNPRRNWNVSNPIRKHQRRTRRPLYPLSARGQGYDHERRGRATAEHEVWC